jgi:hypothetical protein
VWTLNVPSWRGDWSKVLRDTCHSEGRVGGIAGWHSGHTIVVSVLLERARGAEPSIGLISEAVAQGQLIIYIWCITEGGCVAGNSLKYSGAASFKLIGMLFRGCSMSDLRFSRR